MEVGWPFPYGRLNRFYFENIFLGANAHQFLWSWVHGNISKSRHPCVNCVIGRFNHKMVITLDSIIGSLRKFAQKRIITLQTFFTISSIKLSATVVLIFAFELGKWGIFQISEYIHRRITLKLLDISSAHVSKKLLNLVASSTSYHLWRYLER